MKSKTTTHNRDRAMRTALLILLLLLIVSVPTICSAANVDSSATSGEELADGYNWFKGLVQGYGGKLLALASLFVGLWAGLFKGSLTGAAIAVGLTICLVVLPKVMEKMFEATLPESVMAYEITVDDASLARLYPITPRNTWATDVALTP